MTVHRPFRFGVQAATSPDRAAWVDLAHKVEGTGFSVLSMPDHFDDQLAPLPALAVAASVTTTLRVGALVWDNDFKHPVVLAKELATLDLLTDGRVEIGIGAGWEKYDYDVSGIPYERAGIRVDRFVESIAIIKQHFADEPFSQAGAHYRVTDLNGLPKPLQKPHPPILIGAGGPRMLGIAAREADIVGINPTLTQGHVGAEVLDSMSAEAVDAKVERVRSVAGDRLDTIELNNRAFIVSIHDDVTTATNNARQSLPHVAHLPESFFSESPFTLIGPPSKLIEDLLARRERWGISYVIVGPEDVDGFAPVVEALTGT
ncbi:TIGR03621 family F420-dependent LLM class oxidoreductase [Streptomyces cellulosae]|uniref:TIGR03621 family F420-dependent LLM class oxidoreductase n=1 Tax=Streptomyces cellulosae TaxID=1968 RepID=UPI0004CC4CA5|nr:TIGR03621 family F420-dependent LLM class oxidoreductase [Streptomyces cellulosae]